MLTFRNASRNSAIRILLLFISFITFHSIVFAGIKKQTAEEYRLQGYIEQQKGNFNEALSYYTKAISLGLENSVVFNDIGVLYEQLGFDFRAEKYYQQAIIIDPKYLPAYTNLAYFYKRNDYQEKAFKYFRQRYEMAGPGDVWAEKVKDELLKIHPEYKERVVFLESKLLDQELVTQARNEFYNQIKKAKEHHKHGEFLAEEGKYREAILEFNRALSLTPGNPKIVESRKKAVLELAKKDIRIRSEQAIRMLNAGDSVAAKHEIQKILTTIPNKPILIK